MSQTATSPKPYRAFISYSHRDARWSRWLHWALEGYRVPRHLVGERRPCGPVPRRLTPVFRDREDLPSAIDLSTKVREALQRSQCLIVICSPSAARSRWVNEEVLTYKRLGGAGRIFCLLVDGEPFASRMPGREDEECLVPALRYHLGPDGELGDQPAEPVAADARTGVDGRYNAKLKLIAGMLDLELDQLRRRDQQRRTRQLLIISGGSLAGMALAIALSVFAWNQRQEAQQQRAAAEGLIEFMLGDLRTKLDAVGRLDVLGGVGARALAYYQGQRLERLDAEALSHRAKAMQLIGEIEMARGEFAAAEKGFDDAAATTAELLARDADNFDRIFDHAQSVFWEAYVHWQRGELEDAESGFRSYLNLAKRLVAERPDDTVALAEQSYANTNLGGVALEMGRPEDAAQYFSAALEIQARLLENDPGNESLMTEMANAYAFLADAYGRGGKFAAAVEEYGAQLRVMLQLHARAPDNAGYQYHLVSALLSCAHMNRRAGHLSEALALAQEAAGLADNLVSLDAGNADYLDRSARAALTVSELQLHLGRADQAATALALAERRGQELQAMSELSIESHTGVLHRLALAQARLHAEGQRLDQAMSIVDADIHHLQDYEGVIDAPRIDYALTEAYALAGDLHAAAGDPTAAREFWSGALSLVEQLEDGDRLDASWMQAQMQQRLGNIEQASGISEALAQQGYQPPPFSRIAPGAQVVAGGR